jgi:uncharacterized protein YjfI (DUF2170 family)
MSKSDQIKLINNIKRAVGEVMATYGDNPLEFANQMEKLIIHWTCKGITLGIEQEQRRHKVEKS